MNDASMSTTKTNVKLATWQGRYNTRDLLSVIVVITIGCDCPCHLIFVGIFRMSASSLVDIHTLDFFSFASISWCWMVSRASSVSGLCPTMVPLS